jgi:acyl-CoA synthetase (AMP-forming)/AMP-acid ligase II
LLVDLLTPGIHDVRLHFPDEAVDVTLGEVWRRGAAVGRWLSSRPSRVVAAMLTNSAACAAFLVGGIVHGLHLVSLPPPRPGADTAWYAQFVGACCRQAGAEVLAVESRHLPLLPPIPGVAVTSYEGVLACRSGRPGERAPFALTQFTSGSTTEPKGVVLDETAVASNVQAILEWLRPAQGEGACSWLPLSHDMGLIGMFLAALAGGGPDWANGNDVVLLTPEGFRRDPRCWLRACAAFGSAVTAVPNFALEMALRRPVTDLDLGALRTCIVGAEPVRPQTLQRFEVAYRRFGFGRRVFSPAYGLAECTLAVAGVAPGERWSSSPPPVAMDDATGGPWPGEEIVSCGRPLAGVEVRIVGPGPSGAGRVGTVGVRARSVANAYADGAPVAADGGWFSTGDLGWLESGQLHVIGRRDDLVQVAGRNVHAVDVERVVGEVPGIRSSRVAAVQPRADTLVVMAEIERPDRGPRRQIAQMADRVRRDVAQRVGVSPDLVILVPRGRLPVTASGKPRRGAVRQAVAGCRVEDLGT